VKPGGRGAAYSRKASREKGLGDAALGGLICVVEGRRRNRPAEMETLKLRAAEPAHDIGLLGRFDALGSGFHAKAASERQDSVDDSNTVAGALGRPPNEALVDLDLRELGPA
jgi:hypothetical protein